MSEVPTWKSRARQVENPDPGISVVEAEVVEDGEDSEDLALQPTAPGLARTGPPQDVEGLESLGAKIIREKTEEYATGIELLEAFFSGHSRNTIDSYRRDLEAFAAWSGASGASGALEVLVAMRKTQAATTLLHYRTWLLVEGKSGEGYARNTVNRMLTAVTKFLDLAYTLDLIDWKVKVDPVKVVDEKPHEALEATEVEKIFRELNLGIKTANKRGDDLETERYLRWLVMFRLCFEGGLRRAEACRIEYPEGLDLRTGKVYVTQKGGEKVWVQMPRSVVQAVNDYMRFRGDTVGGSLIQPLGSRKKGKMLSLRAFNLAWKGMAEYVGHHCTPHNLRATAATLLLDETGDLQSVSAFMRHKNPSTTSRYDRKKKKRALEMREALSGKFTGDSDL